MKFIEGNICKIHVWKDEPLCIIREIHDLPWGFNIDVELIDINHIFYENITQVKKEQLTFVREKL